MSYDSYIFILLFLPLSTIVYYFSCRFGKNSIANYILLFLSICFYGYVNIKGLLILTTYIFINYLLYSFIYKKNKVVYIVAIVFNILYLFIYKYSNFIAENINKVFCFGLESNIIPPLAISFYVFSQLSFIIDSYNSESTKYSFIEYSIYMLYFPKMIMGPIVNANTLISQINDDAKKKINWDNICYGIILFIIGLSKKVLLADVFVGATDWGFSNIDSLNCINTIVVILSYTLEIYFDFSGYSDMAIGVSKIFNIDLPENFNYPYRSLNISEFWKKWHITLTKFLTKYIYIPLGGNRINEVRTYINTIVVFTISGLWHGSNWNFIIWGILNGVLLVIYKCAGSFFNKINKYIRWIITFIAINLLWTIFRASSIKDAFGIIVSIFNYRGITLNNELIACFEFKALDFVPESFTFIRVFESSRYYVLLYITFALYLSVFGKKYKERLLTNNTIITNWVIILLFVLCMLSLTSNNSFIYVGF